MQCPAPTIPGSPRKLSATVHVEGERPERGTALLLAPPSMAFAAIAARGCRGGFSRRARRARLLAPPCSNPLVTRSRVVRGVLISRARQVRPPRSRLLGRHALNARWTLRATVVRRAVQSEDGQDLAEYAIL